MRALICLLSDREWKLVRDLGYWVGKLPRSAHCISHDYEVHRFFQTTHVVSEVQALEMRCIGVSFSRADGIPWLVHLKGENLWEVGEGDGEQGEPGGSSRQGILERVS